MSTNGVDDFAWWPVALLCGVFLLLAAAELLRPLYRAPHEPSGRLLTNFALGAMNMTVSALLPLSTVMVATFAEQRGIGLLHQVAVPTLTAAAATILARSLAQYGIHRLSHASPLLWRVHRVHHCDTAIDVSTALRNHPLELLVVAPSFWAAALALGMHVPTLAAYELVAFCFAFWGHANVGLPPALDRALRWIVVTPAMHHVHHSARRRETDSNYADVLSLWDRLFGTYADLDAEALRAMRPGLGPALDDGSAVLTRQLLLPALSRRPGGDYPVATTEDDGRLS